MSEKYHSIFYIDVIINNYTYIIHTYVLYIQHNNIQIQTRICTKPFDTPQLNQTNTKYLSRPTISRMYQMTWFSTKIFKIFNSTQKTHFEINPIQLKNIYSTPPPSTNSFLRFIILYFNRIHRQFPDIFISGIWRVSKTVSFPNFISEIKFWPERSRSSLYRTYN